MAGIGLTALLVSLLLGPGMISRLRLFQIGQPVDWCIQETEQPNLSVLTTGPIPPNPAELLGSRRMESLIGELAQMALRSLSSLICGLASSQTVSPSGVTSRT